MSTIKNGNTIVNTKAKPASISHNPDGDLAAMVKRLTAENEQLKARAAQGDNRAVSVRVSAKGAVSVYGLGRFPVTLYAAQWSKLIKAVPEVSAFVDEALALKAVATDKTAEFKQPAGLAAKFVAKEPAAE